MKHVVYIVLSVVLMSQISTAQEKIFAGRTFSQWKVIVADDLDVETRGKAMTAIGVLGHYGNRKEAVEVLTHALATEESPSVAQKGFAAVLSFGDDSFASIEAGLAASDEAKQRATLLALFSFSSSRGTLADGEKPRTLSKRLIPQLLALLSDSKVSHRNRVTSARVLRGVLLMYDPEEFAAHVLDTLTSLAESKDPELASEALQTIGRLGEHAAPAIPLLVKVVAEQDMPVRSDDGQRMILRRASAAMALGYLGAAAKDAIPALEKLRNSSGGSGMTSRLADRALESIRKDLEKE